MGGGDFSRAVVMVAVAALTLSACGGGGGAAADDRQSNLPPDRAPAALPTVTLAPLRSGANVFAFSAAGAGTSVAELDALGGGPLLAQWNPRDPATALAPGMKVSFFGHASDCVDGASNGPTSAGLPQDYADTALLTAVPLASDAAALRWIPQAQHAGCNAATRGRTGPSWVHLNPDATQGGVAMFTRSGPLADSNNPFFEAYDAGGVDGHGLNSNGLGSFVAFRRPWWEAQAVRPFAASGGGVSEARVVAEQSVGSAELGSGAAADTVQVKQQVAVEFINTECQRSGSGASGPCFVQYLFNTATYRAGVSDWASHTPPEIGWVWFDADQGQAPIIEGHLPTAGLVVRESGSALPLFTSQGHPTQHGAFTRLGFDVRISFEQLANALRLVTARQLGIANGSVRDDQLVAMWGARWNDPSVWTLVHAGVGQEVYNNAHAQRRAWIGGALHKLYVGSLN